MKSETTSQGLKIEDRYYQEVRGALMPPQLQVPGYYLLMGQEIDGKGVRFLLEREEGLEQDLFKALTEDARDLRCSIVYVHPNTEKQWTDGFQEALRRFVWGDGEEMGLRVAPPYFWQDPAYGAVLLRQWKARQGALAYPRGSVLQKQIGTLRPDNVIVKPNQQKKRPSGEEIDYPYAFHALRYILAGFDVSPDPEFDFIKEWKKAEKKKKLDGLDFISRLASEDFEHAKEMAFGGDEEGEEVWL